jgi:hypothetical protein
MDKTLRSIKRISKQMPDDVPEVEQPDLVSTETLSEKINLRINETLYGQIQNLIRGQHIVGDFSYRSANAVIRAALEAHRDGMKLTSLDEPGRKYVSTSLRVNEVTHSFFKELPDGAKRIIVERAIRTYLSGIEV